MKNRFDTAFDWDDLRVFLAISTTGTLTGAAQRLGISVATAGRRLDRLEEALGLKLFHRHASGLTPTEDAAGLVERATTVLDGVLSFARHAEGREHGLLGTVTVHTLSTISERIIAPRLREFRRLYPDIALTIRTDRRLVPLSSRAADIALRVTRPTEDRLVALKVATLNYGVFASEGYLRERGHPADAGTDLRGHALITYDELFESLPEVLWLRERANPKDLSVRLSTVSAMVSAARNDAGIAVLPAIMGHGLVCLYDGEDLPRRDVWLAVHEDLRDVPRVNAVWEFLKTVSSEATAG